MSSKKCCLRQHFRDGRANFKFIDLSLDDHVLMYGLRGPSLLDSHIEEDFGLCTIHEIQPESGSFAILREIWSLYMHAWELTAHSDTSNGFAFLEALTSDVFVEAFGLNFDGASAHTGFRVRPSLPGSLASILQLQPGQSFYIGKTTLSLVPEEHSDLPIKSSALSDSNFENYNRQVSQISTPRRPTKVGSTTLETPRPHRANESETFTPILEQVTGQAISGRKGSRKWPGGPVKREVMRTVRDVIQLGHSSSQAEFKGQDESMVDAAINESCCSSSESEVKTGDDIANANTTKPLKQDVVDLEDAKMVGADLEREQVMSSQPSLSLKPRVHPERESGGSGGSPTLVPSKPLSSPMVRMQPEKGPDVSDKLAITQAFSDSGPQLDEDLDDTPIRKKAKKAKKSKKAIVSSEALIDERQGSLQDEVISVKRGISAPTAPSVSVDQASLAVPTSTHTKPRSHSAKRSKQRSPAPSTESKHPSPIIETNSKSHLAHQKPSESSFKSTGPSARTSLSDRDTKSASHSHLVEPSSPMSSTRSTAQNEHYSSSLMDPGTRIVFASSSSVGDSKPFLKFLSSKRVTRVQSVHDCTVLCVGRELKKTSKLILAVLLGKDIVTDSWVRDSAKGNYLLSVVPYVPRDAQKEAEWGISLDKAIYQGKQGLRVLRDQTILFTPFAKKELGKNGFDELKEIVRCAGAKNVSSSLPKKTAEETPHTIVVATHNDADLAVLHELGWRAYVKDIISLSVLRGKLDLESDEFLIKEQKNESRKRKR